MQRKESGMPRPKGFHMAEESRRKTSESMKGNTNSKGKTWKWKNRKIQKMQMNQC